MHLSTAFCEALDREANLVVLLDATGVIRHLNRAWDESFARDQAPVACRKEAVIGRAFLDFVVGDLKPLIARDLERAALLSNGRSVFLTGECNTPLLHRSLSTRIAPLWLAGESERVGLMIQSEMVVRGALENRHRAVARVVESWRDDNGCIVQCGSCRRVRDPSTRTWSMCLELMRNPAEFTSHGICELCLETYYPEPLAGSAVG